MSSLLKSNLAVAAGTAASRLTGLLRVMAFGYVLGNSSLTDAYNQANASPNLVYELLIGGVLSSTLVPLFTRLRHEKDEAGEIAVRSVALVVLAGLTALSVAAAPLIFRLYATATSTEVNTELYQEVGSTLAAFFLLQILFYGLNALASAQLHARGRFFAAAWAPALSNLVIIATLLYVPHTTDDVVPTLEAVLTNGALRWTLGLGATIGIATMALALVPSLRSAGVSLSFSPRFRHPAVARLRRLGGWALGYVIANQVAILVVQNLLVRSGAGNQTAYLYGFTFFVLPHGLLGVSIATTFTPDMTRAVADKNKARVIERADLGIRMVALLTVPAGFGLFVLRRAITGVALQHGECDAACALSASRSLAGFALGLGAFSVYLFALKPFYAHQDARTPCLLNIGENLVNIVVALLLYDRYGVIGIAAAFALAYLAASLWTLQVLSYKIPGFPLRPLFGALFRIVLASAVMAEAVWAAARLVGGNSGPSAAVRVVVASAIGVAVYIGVLLVLQAPELDELRARLRRSPTPPSGPAAAAQ
ncbi:MAG: murein biosynthesis integral membrane protein MurJ [Ilumatobacteraceae bacterium]